MNREQVLAEIDTCEILLVSMSNENVSTISKTRREELKHIVEHMLTDNAIVQYSP